MSLWRALRLVAATGLAMTAALGEVPPALAQSITLTAPLSPVTVPEGDDFFSQVVNHPLQFNARRDFLWEINFDEASIGAQGGLWEGTFASTGAYVFPLFSGFPGGLNTGRLGANYPIDSTRYTVISYRSRVTQRSALVVHWARDLAGPVGDLRLEPQWDGYVMAEGPLVYHPSNAFVVNLHDMGGNAGWTAAPVRALRLDPSLYGPPGTRVGYDWVRVVDPNSAPLQTIRWTTSGVSPGTPAQVNVYVIPDCQGAGDFIARVPHGVGAATLPTAALPAGRYCFRLELHQNLGSDPLLASSGLSAPLTIDGRPTVRILDPSKTTGRDYATTVLGNPWDMDGPADVDNLLNPLDQKAFVGESFANGALTGLAIVVPPQIYTDAQVWVHVDPSRPITTFPYRWLTVTMALDPSLYGNIADKVEFGWVARAIWWDHGIDSDGAVSKAELVYEGVNTITFDLWDPAILDPADANSSQTPWLARPSHRHLRIDLAETSRPPGTYFALYDVRLTAAPEPAADDTFRVRFETADPEGDSAQVALYIDRSSTAFTGQLLDTLTVGPGSHEAVVSTADLDPGFYWIYAAITDSWGRTTVRYSEAPLFVSGGACASRGGLGPRPPSTRGGSPSKPPTPEDCGSR